MSTEKLRLIPGYKLRVIDLLHEVEIAADFTLGELCLMIRDCKEMDLRTLSALIHCPLTPFLEECLGLGSRTTRSQPLSSIHVSWQCEYDNSSETCWPPETTLWFDVYGVGDIWEDYQPGGQ